MQIQYKIEGPTNCRVVLHGLNYDLIEGEITPGATLTVSGILTDDNTDTFDSSEGITGTFGARNCEKNYTYNVPDGTTGPILKEFSLSLNSDEISKCYYPVEFAIEYNRRCCGNAYRFGVTGKITVISPCIKVGCFTICGDSMKQDKQNNIYTLQGNANINKMLFTSADAVFTGDPSTGKGVLTTDGDVFVKLKNDVKETLLKGPGLSFDVDGAAGTLTPKLGDVQWAASLDVNGAAKTLTPKIGDVQWAASLAGLPLWVSGTPITLGTDGVKIEPTLYIGNWALALASFKANILYVPGGDKKLQGFELIQGQLSPGIKFFGMKGVYDPDKDVLTGTASVGFPAMDDIWEASATIRIKPSCSTAGAGLNGFDISAELPVPIPLGTTGLSVAGVTLKVDNICDIPKFFIWFGGDLETPPVPGYVFTLNEMGVGYQWPHQLVLEGGTAKLLGFPVGSLGGCISFKPSFAGVTFKGWTNVAGIYQTNVRGFLSASKHTIAGGSSGTLQIPDFSCSWYNAPCRTIKTAITSAVSLPLILNDMSMDLFIGPSQNGWQGMFRGMQQIGPLSLAVVLQYADEEFDLLVGPNYADVIGLGTAASALDRASGEKSFSLTASQKQVLFSVAANAQSSTLPAIYLKTPQGVTITPSNVGNYPGVHYAADNTLKVALFRVDEAAAGTWTLGVTNLTSSDVTFQCLAPAVAPTTTFTAVSPTSTGVNIQAAIQPVSTGTTVSFFISEQADSGLGTPIAENLPATSGTVSTTWNTNGVTGGAYYLFARTDDGKNPPVITYYSQPIQVGTDTVKPPANLTGTFSGTVCQVQWDASPTSGVKGYRVLYTDNLALPGYPAAVTAPAGLSAQIENLKAGGQYRLAVVAFDGAGNESVPSVPWYAGTAPPENVRQLQNTIPVSDSVARDAWKFYRITVPVNATSLEVKTESTSGQVNLFVKKDSKPDASNYDYMVSGNSASNKITVTSASTPRPLSGGEWYIGVYGKQETPFSVGATVSGGSRCVLSCAATVPAWASPGTAVSLQGSATPQNCSDAVAYTWTFGDGSASVTSQNTSHTYAANGSYVWTLSAVSGEVGCIQSGTIVIGGTSPKVPGAPVIGTATAGDALATVTFSPPTDDGGSPIIEYTAVSSPDGKTGKGKKSPITVTGLTGGKEYSFTVTAINAVGTGPASAPSNTVKIGSDFKITLYKRLNLISLPLQPTDTSIDRVVSSISDKLTSVWSYQDGAWKYYDPADPYFSDLPTMEAGKGYWVDMKEEGVLTVSGSAPSLSVQLNAGWNLSGYNCDSLAITDALLKIAGKYNSVWAFKEGEWKLYNPTNPSFSDLTTMDPGFGYWIDAKESVIWICQ